MRGIVFAALLAAGSTAHAAPDVKALAAKFGARAGVLNASIAPDGRHVALLVPGKGRSTELRPDRNVGVAESRAMAAALQRAGKPGRLVVYPGLDHQLDDADARTDMLAQSAAFLRAALNLP